MKKKWSLNLSNAIMLVLLYLLVAILICLFLINCLKLDIKFIEANIIFIFLFELIANMCIYIFIKKTYLTNSNIFGPKITKPEFINLTMLIIGFVIISKGISAYLPIKSSFESPTTNYMISYILVVVPFVAPIAEEMLFRGVILDGLLTNYSIKKSIIISSLLFGIFHFNVVQGVNAFFGGLLIGFMYIYTKSLIWSIITHTMINIFVLLLALTPNVWYMYILGLILIGSSYVYFNRNTDKLLNNKF